MLARYPINGAAVTSMDAAPLVYDVDGPVFLPGDDAYVQECATHNLAAARRPAVVVAATRPGDIGHAVRFAREHGRPIGVLATGHGASVPAGGAVLVTTRRMCTVTIDASARDRAGGGGRAQAAGHRRAAPYGLAPQEELFWAARGDKDNFGIVTALELDLFKVPHLYGGALYFPGQFAPDVLHAFRQWALTLPEEMTASVALLRLPPLGVLTQPLRGELIAHVRIAYLGPADEAGGHRLDQRPRGDPSPRPVRRRQVLRLRA